MCHFNYLILSIYSRCVFISFTQSKNVGSTLGIPDTVMGLTFVAAGVSVPDALSSLAVIKEGLGDMAVSNAVGSNVFDILVCLGLPWFIQTAMLHPGSHVNVTSRGILSIYLSTYVFFMYPRIRYVIFTSFCISYSLIYYLFFFMHSR